ncbi:MAG: excinuclease ABC subunit UvrA [Treponema sp.]
MRIKLLENLIIKGAREHNLKNIDLSLPRGKLIVISGLSGSGKSSLAFDTIFAEGRRRYMESLSAYARQFLGRMDKPDVDYIEGLSPSIAIEQKTTHKNPRSTVGTITEIYDYYRLLFARIGHAHCPKCGREIKEQDVDTIINTIMSWKEGTKIEILSPVIKMKKGEHSKIIEDAKKMGFVRARIDGMRVNLEDDIKLEKQKKHTIEIVVDRLKLCSDVKKRLSSSIETALEASDGKVILTKELEGKVEEVFFSQKNACPDCGISISELQPRLFSFNSPIGACPECTGIGEIRSFDVDLLIPDKDKSFNERGIIPFNPESSWYASHFEAIAKAVGFTLDTPFSKLTKEQYEFLTQGDGRTLEFSYVSEGGGHTYHDKFVWNGIVQEMWRRYKESYSEAQKESYEKYMSIRRCNKCKGKRLKDESLSVTVGGKNIDEISHLSVSDSIKFFASLSLTNTEKEIAKEILKEINNRLKFLQNVGLDYLTLERRASTLSGGEAQRIRLATQIGSSLIGVLYILDEPSIGLHQRDNQKLIDNLLYLRDIGNTVIVVEHDEQTLRVADYIVDLGPMAGVHGGNITALGSPQEVAKVKESLTGQYLAGTLKMDVPKVRRKGNGKFITVKNAKEHNLKNISLSIPLGVLTCITGVSGSGKSTLLTDVICPALVNKLRGTVSPSEAPFLMKEGAYGKILGIENIDKVINIDQSPIGRTPRSNPATYVGLFTHIRDLFASLPEAKAQGFKAGRFSFNIKGGRCENCSGDGMLKIEMNFLPDVYIKCDVCKGQRFNEQTLEVRYKGKNIAEVLDMSVEEAASFFSSIPAISNKLQTLLSVGLGYIRLGQSALTLSGGEAQRVKLATELSKRSTGKTLYIMDEPTTGLHFADVKMLMSVIQRLVDNGNTVLMIEHNLDVILQADHIIDLGPEGGDKGGNIVVMGSPEEVANCDASYTGHYIKEMLDKQ